MVKDISYDELQQAIKNGVVLADFWAEWCGPCKQLAPVFEELSNEFAQHCEFVKVNVEQNPQAASLGISSIPCLVLFKDGEEAERLVGALPRDALREKIKEMLGL
ncbi:MAG: thioredoxin [Candidatus Nanoarchaeia archaeon]